jgi:Anti-sigma factor NepR
MEFSLSSHDASHDRNGPPDGKKPRLKSEKPGWADGLRTMYNSVLDEPLPDSFSDLLRKLDQAEDG